MWNVTSLSFLVVLLKGSLAFCFGCNVLARDNKVTTTRLPVMHVLGVCVCVCVWGGGGCMCVCVCL